MSFCHNELNKRIENVFHVIKILFVGEMYIYNKAIITLRKYTQPKWANILPKWGIKQKYCKSDLNWYCNDFLCYDHFCAHLYEIEEQSDLDETGSYDLEVCDQDTQSSRREGNIPADKSVAVQSTN